MSWIYFGAYLAILVVCITQTIYPVFMIVAMLFRQSRLLYSFFHQVDTTSKKHGGELVASIFKAHGIDNIFTLPGGHISPIVVASDKLNIKVIDVRHEATAVFAADACARMTGRPGVAVVTAGPGLTNTVTAIKNAQMAESPVVIIAGAAATVLKGRGSLQDIDQTSLLQSATKRCFTVDCIRDIVPTLREAFRVSQVDTPGPVFVELPVDTLYPYSIVSQQFASTSSGKSPKKQSIKTQIVDAYKSYSLNHIFADAWKDQEKDPMPISVGQPKSGQVKAVSELLMEAKRPLLILGSQSVLKPYGPELVAEKVVSLGAPVYLNGSARGLLGSNYPMQFRHARKDAVKEADLVILLGAVCDFRLSYGQIFKRSTKVISVNRSLKSAKLNAGIFWQPTMTIESDVGQFVKDLEQHIRQVKGGAGHQDDGRNLLLSSIDKQWIDKLRERDTDKDKSIESMASEPSDKYSNPLKLLLAFKNTFQNDDSILIADGGDFVASASYIVKPYGPLRWLDPGPYGTLGCAAGFALAAKLLHPERKVLAIVGDGAFGYAIPEIDTFIRHKLPVLWLIGNDASWSQIAREQVPMLGSSIGCDLSYTDYHRVAEGFGAKGMLLSESDRDEESMKKAKHILEDGHSVVVNGLIGKSKFREGSISV